MKFDINIEEALYQRLEQYASQRRLSRDKVIQDALQLLLEKPSKKQWPNGFFEGGFCPEFPDIKELRKDFIESKNITL